MGVAFLVTQIRVLTWNIRKGRGPHRKPIEFEDLEQALAAETVDLLLLQEVDHHWTDGTSQQTQRLSQFLRMRGCYVPNKLRRGGHHGNATFSRFPVRKVTNVDLSVNRVERRGVLHVELDIGGKRCHVFNTHLGLTARQRRLQVRKMARVIEFTCPADEPVLLAGDFNDWTGRLDPRIEQQCGLQRLGRSVSKQTHRSWPSGWPRFSIDRMYTRGFEEGAMGVLQGDPWRRLSDHLPLRADLHYRAPD